MSDPHWTPDKQASYERWRANIPFTNEQIAEAYTVMALGLPHDRAGDWLRPKYLQCAVYLRRPGSRLSRRLLVNVLEFLITKCHVCGRTALYRVSYRGFCKAHRMNAIGDRAAYVAVKDSYESAAEPLHRYAEASRKRTDHRRAYSRMMKRRGVKGRTR